MPFSGNFGVKSYDYCLRQYVLAPKPRLNRLYDGNMHDCEETAELTNPSRSRAGCCHRLFGANRRNRVFNLTFANAVNK
jgi:hypothetical protein